MEPYLRIEPPPELRAALSAAGRSMGHLTDIVGDTSACVCFSDYRDDEGAYSTSTLFMTTRGHWEVLTRRLEEIRAANGVRSHALEYKSRKRWRRMWPSAIAPWMAALRETPGVTVCIGYSRRFRASPEHRQFNRRATESFRAAGRLLDGGVAALAAQKLMPFFVVAPLLQHGVLSWFSDRDALLEGNIGKEVTTILRSYLDHDAPNVSLIQPVYSSELPSEVELALCLPDLVSGIVADVLPSPIEPASVDRSTLDPEAFGLLAELAQMGSPSGMGDAPGKLHISVVDRVGPEWIHVPVGLGIKTAPPASVS